MSLHVALYLLAASQLQLLSASGYRWLGRPWNAIVAGLLGSAALFIAYHAKEWHG